MSDATPPTDPNALLFPAFMYGDKTTCRRKMKAEAKKWAKCFIEGREFPEPKLIPIPPGSVVFTDESTSNWVGGGFSLNAASNVVTIDTDPKQKSLHIQWRAYMLNDLRFETSKAVVVPHTERFTFRRAFVTFVCQYAWGAVVMATCRSLFNEIEFTIPRIEGVLRFWEALDTLKYVDHDERPISLAQLMVFHFAGHLAMWVDQPTGNIRTDLQTAIDQMRQASAEEIHRRLVKRLREVVDTEKRLEHPEWLKSPGVIEAGLEAKRHGGQEWYDDLTSGRIGGHGGFLYHLDKEYPGM